MRVIFLILAGMAMTACAGADGSRGYTETDSAGVTIVENGRSRMARAERWSLQAVPDLEIVPGEVQGPALSQVAGLALLHGDEGRVAVLNQGSHEVLLFREGGELLARFGREGDGPGEFRQITSLVPMAGDSIGAYDASLKVLSVFDSQGTLGRSVSLEEAVEGRFHSLLLPLPGGDMVFFTVSGPGVGFREGVFRVSTESLRIGPGGERRASYGTFPGSEVFGGFEGAGLALFGTTTYAATVGHRLVVGTGETREISYFDTAGALERIARWPDHDRTITPQHEEALFEAAAATEPQIPRATLRDMFSRAPRASRLPPYQGLVGSDDGHVWVGSYPGPAHSLRGQRPPHREWLVFDSLGVLAARAETPEGFQPHLVAGSQVWGVFTHEDGAEVVRAYSWSPDASVTVLFSRDEETVTVFFSRDEETVAVRRILEGRTAPRGSEEDPDGTRRSPEDVEADLEAALKELLRGPTAEEREDGISSWFSAETAHALLSARVDSQGNAVVDFHDLASLIPAASASAGSAMLLAQLNATVFQHPPVLSVEYRVDGSCDAFWNWLQYDCQVLTREDAGFLLSRQTGPPPPPSSS